MRGRALLAAVAALAMATGLAACAPGPDPSAPSSPTAAPRESTSAPPGPTAPLPSPRVVPGPPDLGPAAAPGLVPRLAAMRQGDLAVVARWATPPGRSALGDALTASVDRSVREFAASRGAAWAPGVDVVPGGVGRTCGGATLATPAVSTLTIDCSIVAAAGPLLAERIVVVRRVAGEPTTVSRTVWYADAATGTIDDGTALYLPGAERRVLRSVAEGLRAAGRVGTADDPFAGLDDAGARALLVDSAATRSGVVVTLPHATAGAAAGTPPSIVSVHVPGRLLSPYLSERGAAILAGVATGEPYAAPSAPTAADPVDCTLVACVSITFDDGPSSLTDGLLDILVERRAPATFYVQGNAVQNRPETARRIVAEGHEIANHTWKHPDLRKITDDAELREEIRRTQGAIVAVTGVTATSLRPPYGGYDVRVQALAELPLILWDIDTEDWRRPGPDVVVERSVTRSAKGSIVLMHDTHTSTIEAVPGVIDGLRARGFTLATVVEQFGGALPGAGSVLTHGPR